MKETRKIEQLNRPAAELSPEQAQAYGRWLQSLARSD